MNEQEFQARLLALRQANAPESVIQSFISQYHAQAPAPVSPGAKFADPNVPAMTDTPGEKVYPDRVETPKPFIPGLLTAFGHGASLGFSDKMSALLPGGGDTFAEREKASKQYREQFQKDHPIASRVAEGLGAGANLAATGGLGGVAMPARVAESAPWIARFMAGAKPAAVVGGLYAAGESQGSVPERLKQIGTGTLFSGLAGGLIANPSLPFLSHMGETGSQGIARAAARGGTNMVLAKQATEDFTPELVRHTPAVYSLGPEETAVLNRTIRTKGGVAIGRDIERKLGALENLSSKIGKRFDQFIPKEGVAAKVSPELQAVLDDPENEIARSVAKTAWERVPAARRPEMGIGASLPEEAKYTIRKSMDELRVRAGKGDTKAATQLLQLNGLLTGQGSRPPTTEFLWRYAQAIGDRMKSKPEEMGVLKDLRAQVLNALEENVPGGKSLIQQFAQARNVVEDVGPKISAKWNDIRKRWEVSAHTTPQLMQTVHARTGAEAATGSPGMFKAGIISMARALSGRARSDRTATRAMLNTGQRAKDVLEEVQRQLEKKGLRFPLFPGMAGAAGAITNPFLRPEEP